jgi:hypothetical protein
MSLDGASGALLSEVPSLHAVDDKRSRPTRAFYIVAGGVFVLSAVTVALAAEESVGALGTGLCAAIGWFGLAYWTRTGRPPRV